MSILSLIELVGGFLLVIAVGFLFSALGFFPGDFTKKLSRVVLCVLQPFMLFTALLGISYSAQALKKGLFVMLLSLAVHGVLGLIGFLAAKPLKNRAEQKLVRFCTMFTNGGFLGFPVLMALLGAQGKFFGAFWVVVFNTLSWTWGLAIMRRGDPDAEGFSFRKLFNFGSVPCLLGIAAYAVRLPVPQFLLDTMTKLGDTCAPLVLLIIGANLQKIQPKRSILDPKAFYLAAVRLLLCPVVVAALCRLCRIPDDFSILCLIMSSLPSASMCVMFAEVYDVHPEIASRNVGIVTALSCFSIPLALFLGQRILAL